MAITKQPVVVLASTNVPANTLVTAPVTGAVPIDVRTFAGGEWAYKITNGASAPGSPCTMVLQTSPDGISWFDYWAFGGSTTTNGVTSGSVTLTRGVMYIRVIAYGNTTNAVTVESVLQAVVD